MLKNRSLQSSMIFHQFYVYRLIIFDGFKYLTKYIVLPLKMVSFFYYGTALIITIHMLIVKYPMQFSGPPRKTSNPCSAPLYADEWWFN